MDIQTSAIKFDRTTMGAEFKPTWLDFIRDISAKRASSVGVSSNEFEVLFEKNKELASAVAKGLDVNSDAHKQALSDKLKLKEKNKAITAVTSSVLDSMKDGFQTPKEIIGGVLASAKSLKVDAGIVIIDPVNVTDEDCTNLVNALAKTQNVRAMLAIHTRLDAVLKMIARKQAEANKLKAEAEAEAVANS